VLIDQDETGIFHISEALKKKHPLLSIQAVVGDIRDEKKMTRLFENTRPQIVFHAAAYKHVPLMEKDPVEAVKNNVVGTHILAENALRVGVQRFVFISTDLLGAFRECA
jgi:FlaA1/EpsC-like NDP-sugar epimerase